MSGTTTFFTVSPTVLNFGDETIGETSAVMNVTITNTSNATQALSLTGGSPIDLNNFWEHDQLPGEPAAENACKIAFTFHPASLGAKSSSATIVLQGVEFAVAVQGGGRSSATARSCLTSNHPPRVHGLVNDDDLANLGSLVVVTGVCLLFLGRLRRRPIS